MLYALSPKPPQRALDEVQAGVRNALGVLHDGRDLLGGPSKGGSGDPDQNGDAAAARIQARMADFVRREGLEAEVSVAREPDGAIIRLTGGGALFDTGTADLKPRTRRVLEALAGAIGPEAAAGVIRKIRVEGHTDDVPIRTPRFSSNWQLSTTRATNVVEHLAERHLELTGRLEAAGCAGLRPLASNDTPEGRARNRRVEIRVLQSGTP
jgi:chemotaxis protein MotB